MQIITKAAFARQLGVSKGRVSHLISAGLPVRSDGSIDLKTALEWVAANTRQKKQARLKRPPVSANERNDEDPENEVAISGFTENLARGEFLSVANADRVKANALALKHLTSAQRESGEVIPLDLAKRVLFGEFRSQRDAWLNWPSKIAPLMAADLEIDADRILEALNRYVHQQITELGEPDGNIEESRN